MAKINFRDVGQLRSLCENYVLNLLTGNANIKIKVC